MTGEEAIKILEEEREVYIPKWIKDIKLDFFDRRWVNALELAIKALEQEPCDDCISRQAVLDAITRAGTFKYETKEVQAIAECLRKIEQLPPVTPQPKTGHWIVDRENFRVNLRGKQEFSYSTHCDKCNYHWDFTTDKKDSVPSNYCPNCGAKMESEDKECR